MRILAVADIGAKNVFNAQTVLAFFFTHQFVVNTTSLITAFYWQTALQRAGASVFNNCCKPQVGSLINLLAKLKVPAIIVFVIWTLLFITTIALLFINVVLAFAMFAIMVLTSQGVTIFYVYSGAKIISLVGGNSSIRASKKSPVRENQGYIVLTYLTGLSYG